MISGTLLLVGIGFYYYFYRRTKDILNPIGLLLVIWYMSVSISTLYLSPLQHRWNFIMYSVVIGSSIAVFFAGYLFLPKTNVINVSENVEITNVYIIVTRMVFIISLICVFIEWKYSGFILPGLDFSMSGPDKKSFVESIPFIHYGSVLMPYCAIFSYFELKYSKKSRVYCFLVLFIAIVFYSFMFSLSRGTLIGIFLSFIFLHHNKHLISIKKLVFYAVLFLISFIGLALIRIPKGSMVYTALGNSDGIYMYISSIYTYIAYNFENLLKLINSNHTYTMFHYSLKFIWDLMGFGNSLDIQLYDTEFFNARTYLYSFYHDIGFIGTIIFPFIISMILSVFYKKMLIDRKYTLMLAVLQKAIIMTFFGNYFFGEFIILWPYLVTAVVMLSLNYKLKL